MKIKKLNWKYQKSSCMWRATAFDIYDDKERGHTVTLWFNKDVLGVFKKLSSAKKVAQLIHNG